MRAKSQYSGKTVKVKNGVTIKGESIGGDDFRVEDWAENVLGCPWFMANGNPAAIIYAVRVNERTAFGIPMVDNEVLYGKLGGMGFLLHINELDLDRECRRTSERH